MNATTQNVIFKAADQNHLRSECKQYLIARKKIGQELHYTLRFDTQVLAEVKCRDMVEDRNDTLAELFDTANAHFDKVKAGL